MKRGTFIKFALAVFFVSFLATYAENKYAEYKIAEIRSDQRHAAEQIKNDPSNYGEITGSVKKQIQDIDDLTNTIGGSQKVLLQIVSGTAHETAAAVANTANIYKEASEALDFDVMRELTDIGAAIELVQSAEDASNTMDKYILGLGPKLEAMLGDRGVALSTIKETMNGYHQTAVVEKQSELYKLNAKLWSKYRSLLVILKREWGAWKYGTVQGMAFDSNSATSEFNNTIEQIVVISKQVEIVQFAILDIQSGKGS
jgi:hypothetical protein